MYVCRHHKIQAGLAGILKPAFSTDDDIIYYNSCCLKTYADSVFLEEKKLHITHGPPEVGETSTKQIQRRANGL